MDEIELIVDDKKIKIEVEQNRWSKLYFIRDNTYIKLGADDLSKIVSKLLIAFASIGNRAYFPNSEMFGVMALMDPLTTIAGRDISNSELELLCIEDGGNVIPLVILTIDDIKRWTIQLTDFLINL